MASRAQLVDQVIRPALDEGAIVISDRFLLANVAYQAYAGNLPPDELWQVGLWGTSNIQPDLTIVLDITPDSAQKRRLGPADRMEQREVQYHHRVRQGFLLEAERKPDRIRVLDANRSVEDVHQDICQEVGRALESRQRT